MKLDAGDFLFWLEGFIGKDPNRILDEKCVALIRERLMGAIKVEREKRAKQYQRLEEALK